MNDVEARMSALRQRFAASANGQEIALRTAIDADDSEAAIRIAHHLAGAAGIFGYPALGELARRYEAALDGEAPAERVSTLADDLLIALRQLGGSA